MCRHAHSLLQVTYTSSYMNRLHFSFTLFTSWRYKQETHEDDMATGDDKQSKTSLNEVMSAIDEIGERICKDLEPKILL